MDVLRKEAISRELSAIEGVEGGRVLDSGSVCGVKLGVVTAIEVNYEDTPPIYVIASREVLDSGEPAVIAKMYSNVAAQRREMMKQAS